MRSSDPRLLDAEAGAGHEYRYHLTVADGRMAMLEWSDAATQSLETASSP